MRVGNHTVFPTALAFATLAACSLTGPSDPAATGEVTKPARSPAPRGESPEDRDHVDPDGIVRRGESLSAAKVHTVADVMAGAQKLDGRLVKVTGTVGKVCRKSGCWFELKGDDDKHGIRITSKGYRFFVPSKAAGMKATLEGDIKVRLLDVATAQHYADDEAEGTGKPAAKVTAPVPEISIAAVGLEMAAHDG